MNKIEYMVMSLPYGLKAILVNNTDNSVVKFDEIHYLRLVQKRHDYMPVLRPLSDLIKPCLEDELIPIVELAKICDSVNGYWKIKQEENISAIRYIDSDGITTVLAYHWETQSFGANSCIDNHFEKFTNVHRQLQMFQQLVKWKFDIADLIKKGEAIDYHTLPDFIF